MCNFSNVEEAKQALTQKPLFATSVERIKIMASLQNAYCDQPQPIRFGKIMNDLLANVSVPLQPYDMFAGRCVDRELTSAEEKDFQAFLASDNVYKTAVFSTGHCTLCWQDLVSLGLNGLKNRAKRQLSKQTDEKKQIFLQGAILIYQALQKFALRYAHAAKQAGMQELALCLRTIAYKKPQTFYQALQLCWLVAFVDCAYITENPTLTLGRLDQVLIDFYQNDIQSGVLDEALARRYITDFYCKHNLMMGRGEHQVGDATNSTTFQRILNFDAPQYLQIAGTDKKGKSAVNALTYLFAECVQPAFKNPVLVVRYHKGLNQQHPALWKILCQKARESASMMIYNDDDVIAAIKGLGLPLSVARKYEHFGCNWATLGVNSVWVHMDPSAVKFCPDISQQEKDIVSVPYDRCNSPYGWPHDFAQMLIALKDKNALPKNIDGVYNVFFEAFEQYLQKKLQRLSLEMRIRKRNPSALLIYGDCFYPLPIKRAESSAAGGSDYYFELQSIQGLATVIDSFIAIDSLVFRQKYVDFSTFVTAMQNNFVGYESLHTAISKVEFWGSDSHLSNKHAARFANRFAQSVIAAAKPYTQKEGIVLLPSLQSDTWHLKYGAIACATPNGRKAGEVYSQNSKPTDSACVNGALAMLNALRKMPFHRFTSGAVNLDIQPADFEGESGLRNLCAMLGAYMNCGGLQLQVSSVDVATLKEAQICPQKHQDLRVRVTGYSGVFVDIGKNLQDDIIRRMNG